MKRKFNFGKIAYYGKRKENQVILEVELQENETGAEFSVCGEVWNRFKTDIIAGGQCLDDLAPFFKNNKTFNKILNYWHLYHLNKNHPECEHQRAMGWNEQAGKYIKIYTYTLNNETTNKQKQIKARILKSAIAGEHTQTTEQEKKILQLEYFYKTSENLPNDLLPFYQLWKTEQERAGWVRYDENKRGILCKPCPVCGYKYGTEWKILQIPAEDLADIKNIIQGGGSYEY